MKIFSPLHHLVLLNMATSSFSIILQFNHQRGYERREDLDIETEETEADDDRFWGEFINNIYEEDEDVDDEDPFAWTQTIDMDNVPLVVWYCVKQTFAGLPRFFWRLLPWLPRLLWVVIGTMVWDVVKLFITAVELPRVLLETILTSDIENFEL